MQLILSKSKWQHRCTIGVENKIGYIDGQYCHESVFHSLYGNYRWLLGAGQQLIGAERIRKARSACLSLMLLLATLGLVCTGVLWLGAPSIASWMNLTGDVHDMAVIYLRGGQNQVDMTTEPLDYIILRGFTS